MTRLQPPENQLTDLIEGSNLVTRFDFRSLNEEEAIQHALRIAGQVAPFHAAVYWTVTMNRGVKVATRSYEFGNFPSELLTRETGFVCAADANELGIVKKVLVDELPVYISDYQNHPLADPSFLGTNLYESCYIPIHIREPKGKKLVGILIAANFAERAGYISQQSISLLEAAVYQLQMSLEYREAMVHLESSLDLQRKLYDSIHKISAAQTPHSAIHTLFDCLQQSFSVRACFVATVNHNEMQSVLGSVGFSGDTVSQSFLQKTYDYWKLITDREPLSVVIDLENNAPLDPSGHRLYEYPFQSAVVCPLVAVGEVVGIVTCYWSDPMHAQMDQTVDQLCAVYSGVHSSLVETENALIAKVESLSALGIALESRDGETFGHTQRVVSMMKRFAELLQLEATEMEQALIGAYLHDIGKIIIPDAILLKPGALTVEERRTIELHTLKGYELAKRLPFVSQLSLQIILSHHERWDGTGYPHRLANKDIPLLSRMFALIDVYDALTHARPYKTAWTHEKACEYLKDKAGSQFDPTLTDRFLHLLNTECVYMTEHNSPVAFYGRGTGL